MKKRLQKYFSDCCCIISFLCVMGGLAVSCDNDEGDIVNLLDPQEICGIRYYGEEINVDWNGTPLADCNFEFTPVEQDSTKLNLRLFNIIPSVAGIDVVVDVVPGETEISFSGTVRNYSYELKVEGRYSASEVGTKSVAGKRIIDLRCLYKATGDLQLEKPYIFRFDKNCMYWQTATGGPVEWDGRTYSATDFVQSVLEHISARIAKEATALQVVFHDDATMDISLCRADNLDFVPWMTVKYWYGTTYANDMYLEFTDEQVRMFYDEWIGIPDSAYSPPFINYMENRNLLRMIYWSGEKLCWSIANPYRYRALSMYIRAKGVEGLTEKEKQELFLFRKCLENVEDRNDWMSWCITMNSERIDR